MKKLYLLLIISFFSSSAFSAEYPNMIGVWKGHIRVVSSGPNVADQVAKGGAVLSELDLTVTVEHQDGETFIGKTRFSNTPRTEASTPVWGAIRSTMDEAMFVTAGGGRGHLWLKGTDEFEYCFTSLDESQIAAYCGMMKRQKKTSPN